MCQLTERPGLQLVMGSNTAVDQAPVVLCSSPTPFDTMSFPTIPVSCVRLSIQTGVSEIKPTTEFVSICNMEVSWNRGILKSSILLVFSHDINHPAMGVPPWLWKPPYDKELFRYRSPSITLDPTICWSLSLKPRKVNLKISVSKPDLSWVPSGLSHPTTRIPWCSEYFIAFHHAALITMCLNHI